MIRLSLRFPSTVLLRPVTVEAGLPGGFTPGAPPYRTLWALHCAMADGSLFFESLDAAGCVDSLGIAIVAPSLGNGFFINSPLEAQADFLAELLDALPQVLPLSRAREDTAALGVSMGAFGALGWALRSRAFARVAAISGVFDPRVAPDPRIARDRVQRALHRALEPAMRHALLDDRGRVRPEADLTALLDEACGGGHAVPALSLACGDGDWLSLPQTRAFAAVCAGHAVPVRMNISPGGHDAAFWRPAFRRAAGELFADGQADRQTDRQGEPCIPRT